MFLSQHSLRSDEISLAEEKKNINELFKCFIFSLAFLGNPVVTRNQIPSAVLLIYNIPGRFISKNESFSQSVRGLNPLLRLQGSFRLFPLILEEHKTMTNFIQDTGNKVMMGSCLC